MTHSQTEPSLTPTERTAMRRSDRGVTDADWIRTFLERAPVGVLALAQDGQPFVNMNLFAYDAATHSLILHTARQGRTVDVIAANPRVCLSAMEMGRLLPADEALEFSVEYASVVVFGRARIVTEQAEAGRMLQMLLDKYAPHLMPGQDYRPPIDREIARTAVIQVMIEEWSGKQKQVAEDFPGAYWYPELPVLASLARRNQED